MKSNALKSMPTDELWDLYEKVHSALADKVEAERAKLNETAPSTTMKSRRLSRTTFAASAAARAFFAELCYQPAG